MNDHHESLVHRGVSLTCLNIRLFDWHQRSSDSEAMVQGYLHRSWVFHHEVHLDVSTNRGVSPKMDGLEWKTLLNWMIWGYHYFWKHPPPDFPNDPYGESFSGFSSRLRSLFAKFAWRKCFTVMQSDMLKAQVSQVVWTFLSHEVTVTPVQTCACFFSDEYVPPWVAFNCHHLEKCELLKPPFWAI